MEEILRKLFYKWLIHNVDLYEKKEEMRSLMDESEQKEYADELMIDIDKHIGELINQVKDGIDDASSDLEWIMNIKLDQLISETETEIDDDEWGTEVGVEEKKEIKWETEVGVEEKKVLCNTAGACEAVLKNGYLCVHHEPHIKNIDCGSWCAQKIGDSNADCVDAEEKEKEIKKTFMDNRFGKVVTCSESDDCDFKDCMHIKSHIFSKNCIDDCVNKNNEHKIIQCV